MRQFPLTVIKAGLSRQRTRGGALKDSLYDLLNGYVTTEKTIKSRPGTTLDETLPSGTFGLVHFNGTFHVFASSDVSGIPDGYTLDIIRAPDGEALARVHFAEPFLGHLYVVGEFADGDIYHFWVRDAADWTADTAYVLADVVTPTTANNYKYIPTRNGAPNPMWAPGASRTTGDKVEPTVYNGFYFEVISTSGTNPRSGIIEPSWSTDSAIVPGKTYIEWIDGSYDQPKPTPPPDRDRTPPLDDADQTRYGARRSARNVQRWR